MNETKSATSMFGLAVVQKSFIRSKTHQFVVIYPSGKKSEWFATEIAARRAANAFNNN